MTIASLKTILLSLVDSGLPQTDQLIDSVNHLNPDDFYLDLGILDSFSINSFILSVEAEFNITLNAYDIQSYEFRTLAGLLAIINSKRS